MAVKKLRRFTKIILITLNIFLALLLVAGCYSSYFDQQRFWFFGFFTLGSFYLLIILTAFIIFWFFAKKSFMLISVAAIAITWMPLRELIPVRRTHDFDIQKHAGNIRVMSWNVEHFDILEHKSHPERKQEMINLINEYQPDVACFQEMVGSDSFPSAINYIPDFMKKLGMYDYFYSYNRKLDFDGKHHFGIIIFSRFPVISKETVAYPPKDYNSTFQYVDIAKGADTFRIFNIHLQSLKFSDDNRRYIDDPTMKGENDFEESKSVIAKLKYGFLRHKIQSDRIKKAMNESPYPVILCGDFNDVPNSYAYKTIGKGMRNAFTERGSGIGRTFSSISRTLRIDNIFADERFKVDQYIRVKKKISDHFPIIADLAYKKD